MIKKILTLVFLCVTFFINAQEIMAMQEPQMADLFREEGKIYVVVSVIAMIFIALVAFLVYIERKVKRIEEKIGKESR
jgi:hypothetical protein